MTIAEDQLGSLEPYYPDDFNLQNPSNELQVLLDIFNQHFIKDGVFLNGTKVWVEHKKSNVHGFYAYPCTFVHVITKELDKGRRFYDQMRAKRAHWIKPILLNCKDVRVLVFSRKHYTDAPQIYFWYKELNYAVIVREISTRKQLVTGFIVEERKARQFEKWHGEEPLNPRPHIVCGTSL